MRRASLVVGFFFGKLVLLYALFMIPWPGVRDAYASAYRAGGDFLFRTFGGQGRVYFEPLVSSATGFDAHDTQAILHNLTTRARGTMPMNTRLMGYLPTAFAAALVLATPIPWRRRVLALCLGVALMSTFAAFEMWLRLWEAFTDPSPLALRELPGWGRALLKAVLNVVGRSPVSAYIAPVFVWILTAVRRDDIRRVLGDAPNRAV